MKWFLRLALWTNLLVTGCTILGYLASYLHPDNLGFIQTIGLFMPWLLLGNLALAIFWLFMRKRLALLSIVTLLIGMNQITRFVGFHFNQEKSPDQIIVCTYNSRSYNNNNRFEQFALQIDGKHNPDILCIQEISESHVDAAKESSKFEHTHFHRGKMILTRYPILAKGHIQFDNSINGCVWVDLDISGRTVRVYNTHLRSNRVTREAETLMDNIYSDKAQAFGKFKRMVGNYELASQTRIAQVQTIRNHMKHCTFPILLMGDFNDTPFSYTYQQFNHDLNDMFKSKGLGLGSTYAGSLPGLKIDYIFADENFVGLRHEILRIRISDHFPVMSYLKLKN